MKQGRLWVFSTVKPATVCGGGGVWLRVGCRDRPGRARPTKAMPRFLITHTRRGRPLHFPAFSSKAPPPLSNVVVKVTRDLPFSPSKLAQATQLRCGLRLPLSAGLRDGDVIVGCRHMWRKIKKVPNLGVICNRSE